MWREIFVLVKNLPSTTVTSTSLSTPRVMLVCLMKYWVRSLGPVYSSPATTSSTNSPVFPSVWASRVKLTVVKREHPLERSSRRTGCQRDTRPCRTRRSSQRRRLCSEWKDFPPPEDKFFSEASVWTAENLKDEDVVQNCDVAMGVCSISPRLNGFLFHCTSSVERKIAHLATAKAFSSFLVIIFCSVLEKTRLGTHMPCMRKIIRRTFIFQHNIVFLPACLLLSVCSCWHSSSCCGTLSGSRTFWYFNCTSFLCGNENSYQVMNIWNWFLKIWPTSSMFRILISSIWKALLDLLNQ